MCVKWWLNITQSCECHALCTSARRRTDHTTARIGPSKVVSQTRSIIGLAQSSWANVICVVISTSTLVEQEDLFAGVAAGAIVLSTVIN